MKAVLLASIFAWGLAFPALADDPPVVSPAAAAPKPGADQQQNPCARGSVRMSIGGMDLDATRCALSVAYQIISQQSIILVSKEADSRLMASDLDAAKKTIAELHQRLDAASPKPATKPAQAKPAVPVAPAK